MPETERGETGVLASVRRLGSSVLGLLGSRLELFSVELQEEKLRVIRLLVWLAVACALALAGLLIVIGALALFFWQKAGYAGLLGVALGVFAVAAVVFGLLRRRLQREATPFAGTAGEFRKDMEWLRRTD